LNDVSQDNLPSVVRNRADLDRADRPNIRLYYPDEGFGNVYRRSMLNDLFTDLFRGTNIRKVAELPVESYGIVGAGSLIWAQLGADFTMVSEDPKIVERAKALMRFNSVPDAKYLLAPLHNLPVSNDEFDFSWNFDELLPMQNRQAFLTELCRVSKAAMIVVPNAYSYGQVAHYLYHVATRSTCMHAGPRVWMRHAPVRAALQREGMSIVAEGMVDVPWWPSFPELPNLVRGLLGRKKVEVDRHGIPELAPRAVPPAEEPAMRRKVERNAVIERGRLIPKPLKWFFDHNIYVIGCKPAYRQALGL
jgi:Methyltransferase domain